MIYLITGGSGSGKSSYAEQLVNRLSASERIYLATMEVYDEESESRMLRHRSQRAHLMMRTIEQGRALGTVELPEDALVLLEDLPNWVANEMFTGGNTEQIEQDLDRLAHACRHLIVVTGEVFSAGTAYDEATRQYMQTLAGIARHVAMLADTVVEVVCGCPVVIKGTLP